jgi:hypothetical protein
LANTKLYRYRIDRSSGPVPYLALDAEVDISNPTDHSQDCGGVPCGHAAAVTAILENPNAGLIYVVGFTTPNVPDDLSVGSTLYGQLFGNTSPILTIPTLAVLSAERPSPTVASRISCHDLALPVSAMFLPADLDANSDGKVDIHDYRLFSGCLDGPRGGASPVPPSELCWRYFDTDSDGDIDMADFGRFAQRFGEAR